MTVMSRGGFRMRHAAATAARSYRRERAPLERVPLGSCQERRPRGLERAAAACRKLGTDVLVRGTVARSARAGVDDSNATYVEASNGPS